MVDTLIKGRPADISESLWQQLNHAFPMTAKAVAWQEGDNEASLAYKAGQLEVMEFIKAHARMSAF